MSLTATGSQIAWNDPGAAEEDKCCCSQGCNVIAQSICSDTAQDVCGYMEFDPDEGDRSCPIKFYRKKTTVVTFSESTVDSFEGDPCYSFNSTSSENYTRIDVKDKNEAGACVESCESAEGTSTRNTSWSDDSSPPTSCSSSYSCSGWSSGSCRPSIPWSSTSVVTTKTTKTTTRTWTYSFSGGGCRNTTASASEVTTETLSDEIPFSEMLAPVICDEESCNEAVDPEGCNYCCTDRGTGTRDGIRYVDPASPEGCVQTGSSGTAWIATDCAGGTTVGGQSSSLSLWFKDLIPGTTYRATITYLRCEFAKDEFDEYLIPNCTTGVPCVEGVENEIITDEIVFEADHWAEILSNRCSQCDILYLKCQLEDEADVWNDANPEETPRSVACSAGGFEVPVIPNHYTWFDSCALEIVEP